MDDATTVTRAPDLVFERLGDQLLVLDADHGRYVRLNGTGARIWAALEAPRSLGELVALIAADGGTAAERAPDDVPAFVAGLRERGLVRCA